MHIADGLSSFVGVDFVYDGFCHVTVSTFINIKKITSAFLAYQQKQFVLTVDS